MGYIIKEIGKEFFMKRLLSLFLPQQGIIKQKMISAILLVFIGLSFCNKANNPTNPLPSPSNGLNISWQIQLTGGSIDQSYDVDVYIIDLFDNDSSIVSSLHSKGRKVYCYISVGSWEDWRPDKDKFPPSVIGKDYQGWLGEKWLDIRKIDLLAPIMQARFDLCKNKSFDGIDADNVDGYANDTGFPITYQDQINYNIWLTKEAHKRNLKIGLKNDPNQIQDLLPYFDWILAEDCFYEGWCNKLLPFINAGKPAFDIEYTDTGITLNQFCPQANSMNINAILKNRNLDAFRQACR